MGTWTGTWLFCLITAKQSLAPSGITRDSSSVLDICPSFLYSGMKWWLPPLFMSVLWTVWLLIMTATLWLWRVRGHMYIKTACEMAIIYCQTALVPWMKCPGEWAGKVRPKEQLTAQWGLCRGVVKLVAGVYSCLQMAEPRTYVEECMILNSLQLSGQQEQIQDASQAHWTGITPFIVCLRGNCSAKVWRGQKLFAHCHCNLPQQQWPWSYILSPSGYLMVQQGLFIR